MNPPHAPYSLGSARTPNFYPSCPATNSEKWEMNMPVFNCRSAAESFFLLAVILMANKSLGESAPENGILKLAVPNKIGTLVPGDSLKAQDKYTLALIYEPL